MDLAPGGRAGRFALVVGLALAAGATVVLLASSDTRVLRLGLVAALWAALLSAWIASQYRKRAEKADESAQEAKDTYQRELEREVVARERHELEFEAETRREVDAASREELEKLRSEVEALQQSLRQLLDGEVLYERVALTAQATRMRTTGEDDRYLDAPTPTAPAGRQDRPPAGPASGHAVGPPDERATAGPPAGSAAGPPAVPPAGPPAGHAAQGRGRDAEPQTELIPRVIDPGAFHTHHPHGAPGASYRARGSYPAQPQNNGHHPGSARHEHPVGAGSEPEAQPPRRQRTPDVQEHQDTGSHAAGRPVSEILASYGDTSMPRRRRRRGEDS